MAVSVKFIYGKLASSETEVHLLTNLPAKVRAAKAAEAYLDWPLRGMAVAKLHVLCEQIEPNQQDLSNERYELRGLRPV